MTPTDPQDPVGTRPAGRVEAAPNAGKRYAFWFALIIPAVTLATALMMAAAALVPVLGLRFVWHATSSWPFALQFLLEGLLAIPAYFVMTLLAMVGGAALARPFRWAMTESRGPLYTNRGQAWGCYGIVMGMVHMLLLPRMTPLVRIWITLMGGRCGKRIWCTNPVGFSDLPLLELGDDVAIGSGTVVISHMFIRGHLVLGAVKIGRGVAIGTGAVIIGGVTIGNFATVAPNSFVQPGTVIGAGETWAGSPAKLISTSQKREQAA